jgi:hypothetical protein
MSSLIRIELAQSSLSCCSNFSLPLATENRCSYLRSPRRDSATVIYVNYKKLNGRPLPSIPEENLWTIWCYTVFKHHTELSKWDIKAASRFKITYRTIYETHNLICQHRNRKTERGRQKFTFTRHDTSFLSTGGELQTATNIPLLAPPAQPLNQSLIGKSTYKMRLSFVICFCYSLWWRNVSSGLALNNTLPYCVCRMRQYALHIINWNSAFRTAEQWPV